MGLKKNSVLYHFEMVKFNYYIIDYEHVNSKKLTTKGETLSLVYILLLD